MRQLRVRWLGSVPYREADTVQRALHERSDDDYLLLLEHPHVYTMGSSARVEHLLFDDAASVGAELISADRGGDVTYHGPGQLVGYPIVTLDDWNAGQRDVVAYVRRLEQVLIEVLADFSIDADRSSGYPGVWVGDRKVAAIGVRVARGRTRHGFALNVDPDLAMFDHIVPCGIRDKRVTSMAEVLGTAPSVRAVADRVAVRFAAHFGVEEVERAEVVSGSSPRRTVADSARAAPRPAWMRVKATMGPEFVELKSLVRGLDLHTVCEEAGCPNIYECWSQRTATFMILGDRCTRACGFCLVDTRKPLVVDVDEPARVAKAVVAMALEHVVITCVARDDLADGGASAFSATVAAVREASPNCRIELLIADCKGDPSSLATIFDATPDVLNHNLETVARLQRAARPSAGYARSLGVLAAAKTAGLVTKSGLIVGLGESDAEVRAAIADLRAVGVDILTIGQYLQPSKQHLPVERWWHPNEFASVGEFARGLGFRHVESGPLVRSSYHAKESALIG